jgi:hypothetical protein
MRGFICPERQGMSQVTPACFVAITTMGIVEIGEGIMVNQPKKIHKEFTAVFRDTGKINSLRIIDISAYRNDDEDDVIFEPEGD